MNLVLLGNFILTFLLLIADDPILLLYIFVIKLSNKLICVYWYFTLFQTFSIWLGRIDSDILKLNLFGKSRIKNCEYIHKNSISKMLIRFYIASSAKMINLLSQEWRSSPHDIPVFSIIRSLSTPNRDFWI